MHQLQILDSFFTESFNVPDKLGRITLWNGEGVE
jgi:hypothetical protein